MKITVYGIRNCDTMKKAFAWLDAAGLAYDFHDYKRSGIDPVTLQHWCEVLGHERLINRRGTTWRKLDEASRQAIDNETGSAADSAAIALMQAQPSLIRRPLIAHEDAQGRSGLLAGFDAAQYTATLLEVQP
ncbi:MAG: ArsC family reductase [Thauera sp.]|jgi:arsenate reductase|nr:ArsC family reductase [Thauera sp.]